MGRCRSTTPRINAILVRKLARIGNASCTSGLRGNRSAGRDNGRSDGGLRGLRSVGVICGCGVVTLARASDGKLER